ncbi:hypothetical protein KKG31_01885 [Patescibacteria group bacterium]|nr:hypothetical protein [Patescibacteria group bacterium]MBU1757922.1 hypothetical protein [Patescibacteria group bacterium]
MQHDLKQEMINEETTRAQEEMAIKYETEKKETQIQLQDAELKQADERQQKMIYGISAALLLVLVLGTT